MNVSHGDAFDWSGGYPLSLKRLIWSFYIIENFTGTIFSLVMFCTIVKKQYNQAIKNSTDVLVGGISTGCIGFGIGCAAQCWNNAIHGHFTGGSIACEVMSWYHIISILVTYACLCRLSYHSYCLVVRRNSIKTEEAWRFIACSWIFSIGLVIGIGQLSQLYFSSSGTFCLYAWNSPVFFYVLIPMFLCATIIMVISYIKIVEESKRLVESVSPQPPATGGHQRNSSTAVSPQEQEQQRQHRYEPRQLSKAEKNRIEDYYKIRRRLTTIISTFVLCWILIPVAAIVVWVNGSLPSLLDVLLAVFASASGILLPIFYGYQNKHLRVYFCQTCCCNNSCCSCFAQQTVEYTESSIQKIQIQGG